MESSQLEGRVVLVVEDEPLVGLEIVEALAAKGAHVISARREPDAITSVDGHQISAALLDIDLGGEDCLVLCEYLSQRQIPRTVGRRRYADDASVSHDPEPTPFAFYTGYTTPPDGWNNVPIINKPAHRAQIVDTVERLCGSHQQAA